MRHATVATIGCFHPDKSPTTFVNIARATAIANAAIDLPNLCPTNKNTKISYLKKV